jgi:hypothetical protein
MAWFCDILWLRAVSKSTFSERKGTIGETAQLASQWCLRSASVGELSKQTDLYIYYILHVRKSIQHHATPWFEAAILKNFEEFSTCVPWLVARSIYPNHSKSQSVHKDAWMVRIFATLSQEMFLPYLPYWSNCRGFGRTVPWGLQQQDAFGPFGLRDGKVRRRLHFDRRAKLHAALSKVCAEQVGWTLDSMSFFLFLSLLFVCCKCYKTADSCKPR